MWSSCEFLFGKDGIGNLGLTVIGQLRLDEGCCSGVGFNTKAGESINFSTGLEAQDSNELRPRAGARGIPSNHKYADVPGHRFRPDKWPNPADGGVGPPVS